MIAKLAFQNLLRNRRRTLSTILTVAFGVLIIVVISSLLKGMAKNWARIQIEATTGAIQIEHKEYRDKSILEPLKTTMNDSSQLIEEIESVPGVVSAYGKLRITGVISSGSRSTVFDGSGVDTAKLNKTLPIASDLVIRGKALDGNDLSEVVLGQYLAEELELEIGDPVILAVKTYSGVLDIMYGKLVGIKNGPHFPAATYVELELSQAQKLLRMEDRVSQVSVRISDQDAVEEIAESISSKIESSGLALSKTAVLRKFPELIPNYVPVTTSMKTVSYILGFIFLIIVSGGIANMMYMTVRERRSEIGTIMAIGMKTSLVRSLFVLEGGYMGLVGAIIGVVIASFIVFGIVQSGGIPITNKIVFVPILDYQNIAISLVMAFLISLLSTWLPASMATKLNTVKCLYEH